MVIFPDCPLCRGTNLVNEEGLHRGCKLCELKRSWPATLGDLLSDTYKGVAKTPLTELYKTSPGLIIEYKDPVVLRKHLRCFLKNERDKNSMPLLLNKWKEFIPTTLMSASIEGTDSILAQYTLLIMNFAGGGAGFPAYEKASQRHQMILASRLGVEGLTTWVAIQHGLGSMGGRDYIKPEFLGMLKSLPQVQLLGNTSKVTPTTTPKVVTNPSPRASYPSNNAPVDEKGLAALRMDEQRRKLRRHSS